MSRTSILHHPENDPFLLFRKHFVDMFYGDSCAASVLACLEFESNGERDRMERTKESGPLWIQITTSRLCELMFGLYSGRRIQERLQWLENAGLVSSRGGVGGQVKEYLLDVEKINEAARSKRRFRLGGQMSCGTNVGQSSDEVPAAGAPLYLKEERIEEESNNPSNSPTLETYNYANPLSSKTNSGLEDSTTTEGSTQRVEFFSPPLVSPPPSPTALDSLEFADSDYVVNHWNRHRGAKKLNGSDKNLVVETWKSEYTESEVDAALDGFFSSDWGKANKYPVRAFLKQFDSWLEQGRAEAPIAPAGDITPQVTLTTREVITTPQKPPERDFVAEWNASVKLAPKVDTDIRRIFDFRECLADAEFVARFQDIVGKVEELYAKADPFLIQRKWLKFKWVIGKSEGETERNWRRLLAGAYDREEKKSGPAKDPDFYNPENVKKRLMKLYGFEDEN